MPDNNVQQSKNRFFQLLWSGDSFTLSGSHGGVIEEITLDKLVELSTFLNETVLAEQRAFDEFLEAEYRDWAESARQWRNYAATGDPDVSPEEYYRYD